MLNKHTLPMRLQFFADEGGEGTDNTEPKEIPAEYNDLVNSIVKKSNAKYLKQIDSLNETIDSNKTKVDSLSAEVEKLKTNGMGDDEKQSYQMKKLQDELNGLKEKNKSLNSELITGQIRNKVLKRSNEDKLNLTDDQLSLIVSDNEDETFKKYDQLKSIVDASISSIKQKVQVPNTTSHLDDSQKTKELVDTFKGSKFSLKDIK